MQRRTFFRTMFAAGAGGLLTASCDRTTAPEGEPLFSFIHATDIHVQPEQGATEGFLQAIGKMNELRPDFVITGGDLIMDALGQDEARSVQLYDLYDECCRSFDMPVHNTMGNHEVFGLYVPELVPVNHPLWGKEMFKQRLGNGATYRSFDHKNVHVVLLDSVQYRRRTDNPAYEYYGGIGEEQMAWLEQDLAGLPPDVPVIMVSHIPIISYHDLLMGQAIGPHSEGSVLTDGAALFELISRHNVIAFFEGHIHVNELYEYLGVRYIDTGAVSGSWWSGPRHGHPEGFNVVDVYSDHVEYTYTTYGWDASVYA